MAGFASIRRTYVENGSAAVISKGLQRVRLVMSATWAASHAHRIDIDGLALKVRVQHETTGLLGWKTDWKTSLIGLMLFARGGPFVDVGANVGQTLLDYLAAPRKHGYIAFEPMHACLEQLHRLVDDNRLADCTVVPCALSDRNILLDIYRHHEKSADPGATTVCGLRPDRNVVADLIPSYRFDDIRGRIRPAGAIGVIKIDVEGAELPVIRGMERTIRADRPWILCEVLDRDTLADAEVHNARAEQLRDTMHGLGYAILRVQKSKDQTRVIGLEPISTFPSRVYEETYCDECDYLFVPADQTDAARAAILAH